MKRLKISDNSRFLMTEDNEPFFWMADTAWELLHRCTKEQIESYLENRRLKRFNVIQTVVLAEMDGLRVPNEYGHLPLIDENPMTPNEAYFEIVDFMIQRSADLGLYVALLPTWGDKVAPLWRGGPKVFNEENAEYFGHWVAQRYKQWDHIIWVLGGDRPIQLEDEGDYCAIWDRMAKGIREVRSDWLITYHPNADRVLEHGSMTVHDQSWADFVMYQSSHYRQDIETWDDITTLYQMKPAKPCLDGEINYEDHPIASWPDWDPEQGYFRDYEVRRQLYRSVFAGGCGVSYGHHHVWQMWDYHRPIKRNGFELRPWYDALDRPAAFQVKHLVNLMLSHSYFTRIPDQSMILSDPGEGQKHICATRDSQGAYAMIYLPVMNQTIQLDLSSLQKPYEVNLYDPRTGYTHPIEGQFSDQIFNFTSPNHGPDWVLLIEHA